MTSGPAKLLGDLRDWLRVAEDDLTIARDAIVIFLTLSYLHVAANVMMLSASDSPLRDCASVSLTAFLTAIALVVSVTASMAHRSMYGYVTWVDLVNTAVGVAAGSLLQMSAKATAFHSSINDRDECSLLVFSPALIAWFIGEAAAFLSGAVLFLHWRREPPFGQPRTLVLTALVGVGVGLYFLIDLAVAPALSSALAADNATAGASIFVLGR